MTESDVLRSALASALGTGRSVVSDRANKSSSGWPSAPHVKLSVRLLRPAAYRLNERIVEVADEAITKAP